MKIALITDTHWGARGDSLTFLNYFRKFYDNVFFPYLEEHNIKTLIHLGDVVDRRKFINFKILNDLRTNFIERLWKMGVDTHIIIGNHDTFHKNTNELNSLQEIFTSAATALKTQQFKDMGIDLIESTPEEIKAVVIEMVERLAGTWQTTEEDC